MFDRKWGWSQSGIRSDPSQSQSQALPISEPIISHVSATIAAITNAVFGRDRCERPSPQMLIDSRLGSDCLPLRDFIPDSHSIMNSNLFVFEKHSLSKPLLSDTNYKHLIVDKSDRSHGYNGSATHTAIPFHKRLIFNFSVFQLCLVVFSCVHLCSLALSPRHKSDRCRL